MFNFINFTDFKQLFFVHIQDHLLEVHICKVDINCVLLTMVQGNPYGKDVYKATLVELPGF